MTAAWTASSRTRTELEASPIFWALLSSLFWVRGAREKPEVGSGLERDSPLTQRGSSQEGPSPSRQSAAAGGQRPRASALRALPCPSHLFRPSCCFSTTGSKPLEAQALAGTPAMAESAGILRRRVGRARRRCGANVELRPWRSAPMLASWQRLNPCAAAVQLFCMVFVHRGPTRRMPSMPLGSERMPCERVTTSAHCSSLAVHHSTRFLHSQIPRRRSRRGRRANFAL